MTKRIILIIVLIIIIVLIYSSEYLNANNKTIEKFDNFSDGDNGFFNKNAYMKKNKMTKKTKYNDTQDYGELEVKILSKNNIYDKLNKYVKRYDVNLIYNLGDLEPGLPLVITYDNQSVRNDKNESFVNFLKGLIHYKYNFVVCGINTKWDGWYGRYKTYLELLDNIPPEQLVFVTDARDVLVNDSPVEFVKNYNKITKLYNDEMKNKIIFGTEVGCCVNQMWHFSPGTVFANIDDNKIKQFKDTISKNIIERNSFNNIFLSMKESDISKYIDKIEIEQNKAEYNQDITFSLVRDNFTVYPNGKKFPWEHWLNWNNLFRKKFTEANIKYKLGIKDSKYQIIKLNFGMMVGSCSSILKMLITFDLRAGEDDQHLASEFFYSRPEMVILDYTQILLSNTGYKHSFRRCTSKTMNNTHYNINFNDHLSDHDEYISMDAYTREDIPEQGIMYGFDIQNLKYFFTYDNIITYPCFIQSPGKDWNCYNELLYKLPYCDDKMCSYYYNLEQTQRYNVRDIITHEFKNQSGNMKIEWILKNLLNPLYWALDLFIVRDIFDIIENQMSKSETFVLLDSGNLMGYNRFKQLDNQHIMPWDDDFDLGWYSLKNNHSKETIEEFFKLVIKKGYEIFVYYKEISAPYSSQEKDHFTTRLNTENILQITNLINGYEIVLFNIAISTYKYKEILKIFNMSLDYEEKYVGGTIKIPSVDIFMYGFNEKTKTFDYNKLFGSGYVISLDENCILPIKSISYNKINVKTPGNIDCYLDIVYGKNYTGEYKDLNKVIIKRHESTEDKQKEINDFNNLNLTAKDNDIVLITKIFNNFVNKYYEIINSNENIKRIILSK